MRHLLILAALALGPLAGAAPPVPGTAATVALADGRPISLVWIPAGTFVMGSAPGEPGRRPDEGPLTRVTISRGFWMGRTHVTQGQFQAVMGFNPSAFQAAGPEAPVESVSWAQAVEFGRRLTVQEAKAGRLPAGYSFTLPTEAEWEYACRAGATGQFYNGETEADLARAAWYKGNAGGTTHPVAQREPNKWGLFDMLGNLWVWCYDWYGPLPGGSVTDFVGPPTGAKRNNRGGSWDNFLGRCRCGARSPDDPRSGNTALGFRLVLAPALPGRP